MRRASVPKVIRRKVGVGESLLTKQRRLAGLNRSSASAFNIRFGSGSSTPSSQFADVCTEDLVSSTLFLVCNCMAIRPLRSYIVRLTDLRRHGKMVSKQLPPGESISVASPVLPSLLRRHVVLRFWDSVVGSGSVADVDNTVYRLDPLKNLPRRTLLAVLGRLVNSELKHALDFSD